MRSSDVTFRKHTADIETPNDDDKVEMDIIEISYPDGKVVAFPADSKSPETGIRYRDMFRGKYDAFKKGGPDPDKVSQLEREIAEKQAELDGMKDDKIKPVVPNHPNTPAPTPSGQPNTGLLGEPHKIDQPVVLGDKHEPAKGPV